MKTSLHNQRGALGAASGHRPQHNDAPMCRRGAERFHADAARAEKADEL